MTLTSACTPRVVLTGNGTRGPYSLVDSSSVAIRLVSTGHLKLTRYSSTTDETGTVLALTTDYTVGGTQDARTFTLSSAQAVLTSSQRIVAERVQAYTQDLDLTTGGAFNATSLESRFDKLAEFQQELKAKVDRAIMASALDTTPSTMPLKVNATSGDLLAFDSDKNLQPVTPADIGITAINLGTGWQTILGSAAAGTLDNLAGIRSVATYAALTALVTNTGLADNAIYYTYARTTEEDCGAGFWRYDSASTATADGGTILAIDGAGAGRFFRQYSDPTVVRLSWFTAGSIDLTTIINAVISAASASAGIHLIVDVPGSVGGQIVMNKRGKIEWGPYTYNFTSTTSQILIGPYKGVEIFGQGFTRTIFKATAAVVSMIYLTGYDTNASNRGPMYFHDIQFDGNDVGLILYSGPAQSYPTFESQNYLRHWNRVNVHGWMTAGIKTNASEYWGLIENSIFYNNQICIYSGAYSDVLIRYNYFAAPKGSEGMIVSYGCQQAISDNRFTLPGPAGVGAGRGPDIEIRSGASSGTIWVSNNYHGPETEDSARYKVIMYDAADLTSVVGNVAFQGNKFFGVDGQKAVKIASPIRDVVFDASNVFDNFATVIDDVQTIGAANVIDGDCVFQAQVHTNTSIATNTRLFTNGGRQFSRVTYPPTAGGMIVPRQALRNHGARQRIRVPSDWLTVADTYSWVGSATYTDAQTDPFGTTKAAKLTKPGATPNAAAVKRIDTTNLLTDTFVAASGTNGRVVLELWLKAGTLTTADIVVYDSTDSKIITGWRANLYAAWTFHEFVATGIDPSHDVRIYIYPGASGNSTAGYIYASHVRASDCGADWLSAVTLTGNAVDYIDTNEGAFSSTTDGSGDLTITHGMDITPTMILVTTFSTTFSHAQAHTIGATTFKIRFFDAAAAAQTAASVSGAWRASA